ncbi:hypothetical protein FOL47_009230 [Perkinsus chesapeaki]|uniref:Uncharacterized protein n=1 Tax=Perkinsus chesapeaki TaxID=330153 RepID=A0A7J6MS81_PERCH|nr:hypothetical protein FOL47_009230 [Perkinsus chesapeaki]
MILWQLFIYFAPLCLTGTRLEEDALKGLPDDLSNHHHMLPHTRLTEQPNDDVVFTEEDNDDGPPPLEVKFDEDGGEVYSGNSDRSEDKHGYYNISVHPYTSFQDV